MALRRNGELDRALGLADEVIDEAGRLELTDIAARAGAYRSYILELFGDYEDAFRLINAGRVTEGLATAEEAATAMVEHPTQHDEIRAGRRPLIDPAA